MLVGSISSRFGSAILLTKRLEIEPNARGTQMFSLSHARGNISSLRRNPVYSMPNSKIFRPKKKKEKSNVSVVDREGIEDELKLGNLARAW